jgi:hypothetical protein
MTRKELEWLYEKANTMESVVEIGSFKGRSTFVLASGCNGGNGKVYAIDPFTGAALGKCPEADGKPTFDDFMKNCGHFPHLSVIVKKSQEAADLDVIPPEVDMVFLDGNHDYEAVMADLATWAPRTKKLICGHDLNDPMYPGVKQAIYEYFGADAITPGPDSLWAVYSGDE